MRRTSSKISVRTHGFPCLRKSYCQRYIEGFFCKILQAIFIKSNQFQIRMKCRSKRNDIAANIRTSIFAIFGEERLTKIDNTTPSRHIAEWKASEKTREAYAALFNNQDLLTKIGHSVFKQYREKPLPSMHCAFILSICDILLNPSSSGIKC